MTSAQMNILCDLNENPLFWIPSHLAFADWEVQQLTRLLLFKGISNFLSFAWIFVFLLPSPWIPFFRKRNPNYHLMTCKETSLRSKKTPPRRTEKAKRTKRRETEVLKEKAKANERARAGRDQGRRSRKRRRVFRRKASLVWPQQCLGIDFFSPQRCLIWRKPWKQPSPLKSLTKPSWTCPHSRPTLQLKPPLWCPVHYLKQRFPRR